MWLTLYLLSTFGLNITTRCLAIWARLSLRISSSVFPLNMQPLMTSIHPVLDGMLWSVTGSILSPSWEQVVQKGDREQLACFVLPGPAPGIDEYNIDVSGQV